MPAAHAAACAFLRLCFARLVCISSKTSNNDPFSGPSGMRFGVLVRLAFNHKMAAAIPSKADAN